MFIVKHNAILSGFRNQDCKDSIDIGWNTQTFDYFQGFSYLL